MSVVCNMACEIFTPTTDCSGIVASQVPLDVMATVFSRADITVRDLGASRLVCCHWRSAIDRLTVRRLALRSPGPGHCTLQLLRRFPLLHSLSLGSLITSNRAAFSWALGQLSGLVHLTRLSLEFSSASAVRLPASLQALSRLQALSLSVGVVQPGQVQSHVTTAAAMIAVSTAVDDDMDVDGGGSATTAGLSIAGGVAVSRTTVSQNVAAAAAAAAATAVGAIGGTTTTVGSGAAAAAAPAAQHVPPAGLLPLLSSLSSLTSLELANLAISVPDVLAAVRLASTGTMVSAPICGGGGGGSHMGCLRRLVLVGSGVNLTGVGDPAALAQLAVLETLHVDGCTGADTLVPLLRHLRGVRHLTLAGMDYAWAAAAGYHHRRAGFDSSNDLQQFDANGPNQFFNGINLQGNGHVQHPFGAGGVDAMDGGAAAAIAAAASGRPLAFLLCLPQLASLSLAGSFLRTLPNRDIGGLAVLTALDLSSNGIDDLPQGLASLPLLSRLDVSHNELVSLPAWLRQMQSLESLSCHHNCLERFPALLYDLTRLSYLAMGHNRVSWWPVECVLPRHRRLAAAAAAGLNPPDSIAAAAVALATSPSRAPSSPASTSSSPSASAGGCLAAASVPQQPLSLVCLDLSHNRLFGLPGGLPLLCALRSLRLRESLAGLDGSGTARAMSLLAGLTALRELDLSSNHLDQHAIVPLSELRGLRQLWLADNGLEELPLGLAHLSHLTLLSLRANRFTEVPVCLRWLSDLEVLDLSCNRLSELPHWIGGGANGHLNGHVNGYNHLSDSHRGISVGNGHHSYEAGRFKHQDDEQTCFGQHRVSKGANPVRQELQQQQQQQGPNQEQHQEQQDHQQQQGPHHHLGLIGLRHLDVSQQYSVVVRESAVPHIPPRLEVQPPRCLYGPLQGDLPEELLRLRNLRVLVLQRHPLLKLAGSAVLRRLQARGVEVIHPRPLRVEALPGAAAAAFTTAAAAGGLLFPGRLSAVLRSDFIGAAGPGVGVAGASTAYLAAAAAATAATGAGGHRAGLSVPLLSPREIMLLLAILVVVPLAAAAISIGFVMPPPLHVVVLVLVVALTRLAVYGICLNRDLARQQQR
ncbi:hypothetical protein Vretifemale_11115 [Volvox reticuliferus]|uniref:Disease resistance R13L4/SHOC-2-like LRR domain-containing protein n=1 Tax=Volvox reticuliferus TaxID=1737510 RepID=A0A8J4FQT9_9CHLO|nr:hypothetical protein Vretifemale_11115 [Volvox reticuliferus]